MIDSRAAVALSFAERYATLAVHFVSTIVLARMLTPGELGIFAVGMAVVSIAHALRDFGISSFIIQRPDLRQDHVYTVVWISIVIAWSIGALVMLGSGPISRFYGQTQIQPLLAILSLSFLVLPFSSVRVAIFKRNMAFPSLLRISIASALTQGALSVLLVYFGLSYLGLALASLTSAIVTLIVSLRFPIEYRLIGFHFADWRSIWHFTSRSTAISAIGNIGAASPDLVVGKLLGFEAVGLFSRAMGLVQIVERTLMDGVRGVALPYFAARHRSDRLLTDAYLRSLTLVLGISWPALATFAVASESVISVLYGERWLAAAPVAAILFVGAALRNIASLLGPALVAGGHVAALLPRHLLWQASALVLLLAGVTCGLPGVAVAYTASEILGAALFMHAAQQYLGAVWMRHFRILADAAKVALATALPAAAVGALTDTLDSHLIRLLLIGTVSFLSWMLYIFASRHPLASEIGRLANALPALKTLVKKVLP